MLSDKPIVRNLVEICAAKGIDYVIISPGSRNAPLIISFSEHGHFTCLSIPDERVAGYFALGIAQQTRKPVIITCTSGTASLNFAPAIAEAFYQKIPLLILTADRPVEWIHQGEGQSINQQNVFANYVKRSYQLSQERRDKDGLWSTNRMVSEAIDHTTLNGSGPVHLNIPFQEPLYNKKDYKGVALPKISTLALLEKKLPLSTLQDLANKWQQSNKKMILCGLLPKDPQLMTFIKKLAQDPSVIVLSETTSNIIDSQFITQIDGVLISIQEDEKNAFQPDVLITIGGAFISKKIKQFLRQYSPQAHWHIEENEVHLDTFQSLTDSIPLSPSAFFQQFCRLIHIKTTYPHSYQQLWRNRKDKVVAQHKSYLADIPWSDLKVFDCLLSSLPPNSNVQLGNSTPIRYVQLFEPDATINYHSNRGVAGIDGSTSTAAGAALVHENRTILLTGDIAFFYDSNAFWHHHLSPHLRVVLINNGGGNIFKYIPGPSTTKQLNTYFVAEHNLTAKHIAKTFNLAYFLADTEKALQKVLKKFFRPQKGNRPAILEIKTPNEGNAAVLRAYFEKLE